LLSQKKINEALKVVEKALEINPNYPQSLYQSSVIYYEYHKDYANAEKFILQTLKNSPQYLDALFLASRIYEKLKHPAKAIFYMEKYYDLIKDSKMEKSMIKGIKDEISRLKKIKSLKINH
jgi:tetratricopeptide (TPR) repeat protein